MRRLMSWVALVVLAASLVAQEWKPPTRRTFYATVWPGKILRFDPETDTVTGEVTLRNGIHHDITLSYDRKRMIVVTGQKQHVEVVDLASMSVVADHSFARDGQTVRVEDVREIPGGKKWYVRIERVKKLLDRYEILDPEWIEYTLEGREEGKPMKDLPKVIRSGARVSPDGTKWHVFGKDIIVVDPVTLKEEAKVNLSEPAYAGMGSYTVRGDDYYNNTNPAAYRMIWSMTDPVKKNRTFSGRLDIDMKTMKIVPNSILEWGASTSFFRAYRSIDNKIGIAVGGGGRFGGGSTRGFEGEGESEVMAVTWDMDTGKRLREGRTRIREAVSLVAVNADCTKSYWLGRGHEFVVLDANHQYLKTIEMPGELAHSVFVIDE